jgi:hypothetical protein
VGAPGLVAESALAGRGRVLMTTRCPSTDHRGTVWSTTSIVFPSAALVLSRTTRVGVFASDRQAITDSPGVSTPAGATERKKTRSDDPLRKVSTR